MTSYEIILVSNEKNESNRVIIELLKEQYEE